MNINDLRKTVLQIDQDIERVAGQTGMAVLIAGVVASAVYIGYKVLTD